jgi:hypothetical protein
LLLLLLLLLLLVVVVVVVVVLIQAQECTQPLVRAFGVFYDKVRLVALPPPPSPE